MSVPSIIAPLSAGERSRCGYCARSENKSGMSSYHKTACKPLRLTCQDYQKMIDRGWRRSGSYCYKPDLKRSCCPQYTIRLDATQFKASRSQRKLVHRWNRFILFGDNHNAEDGANDAKKSPRKPPKAPAFESLSSAIHASEHEFVKDKSEPVHKFEVTLEPASYSDEKYQLYKSYQEEIHQDEKNSPVGFKGFLVESPLIRQDMTYTTVPADHLPQQYGSYHQMYRLDGELIAMGVIDVLPSCVSSVYFMYEKKWDRFSLGKLSALREISLAQELYDAGVADLKFLYMGFYIHSCQKMRYKGEYHPSFLADPEDYTWFPLETCRQLLDQHRYVDFAHPEHSTDEAPDEEDMPEIAADVLQNIKLADLSRRRSTIIPIATSAEWRSSDIQHAVLRLLAGLGPEVSQDSVFHFAYEI